MFLHNFPQAFLLAILSAAGPPATVSAQQQSAFAGEITALRVLPLPAATYRWTLFCDSSADFAMLSGACGSGEAGFVDGISDEPTVQVLWNKPGTYFVKILVISSDGCSNFKVGIVEVLPNQVTARIYPNPVNGNDLNFEISLEQGSAVIVDIYSPNCQLISRVFDGYLPGGQTKTIFFRNFLQQGIYTYRIQTESRVCSGRIICIRVY